MKWKYYNLSRQEGKSGVEIWSALIYVKLTKYVQWRLLQINLTKMSDDLNFYFARIKLLKKIILSNERVI